MQPKKVLLLASRGAEAERIAAFCKRAFDTVDARHGHWGEPLPQDCLQWTGDLVVSYCSRWIVPEALIKRATLAAINFHPAPPHYPGIGGLNWALYNGDRVFGVTCHHMSPAVDSGPIVEARELPVLPTDDVSSLFDRVHLHLEALAYDTLGQLALGKPLRASETMWSGQNRTRSELNALADISMDMPRDDIARRIRATSFGDWKPTTRIAGYVFELKTRET